VAGTVAAGAPSSGRPLRGGDRVEVRSASEIFATLDDDGCLDAVPFMPEMLRHVGQRYTVSRRVDKICDTITCTGSRRMHDTVYLEDLRCDGSGHGGCQAACRIYWKEAWLRRVGPDDDHTHASTGAIAELEPIVQAGTRARREFDGESADVWRCQATEALKATTPLKTSDVRQYWRELRSANSSRLRFFGVLMRGFVMEVASRIKLIKRVPLTGDGAEMTLSEPLDLHPGDVVRVRSAEEIARTLDENGLNRRLSFDRELLRYCGRTCIVKDRVERIIDDRTGRMLHISADAVTLEGVTCSGERTVGCWFCPREIYSFWREAWLVRVDDASTPRVGSRLGSGVRMESKAGSRQIE
jgi:hypothetical protein